MGLGDEWLALSCARDGTVGSVLRDDFGIARPGAKLTELVDSGSMAKASSFLATVVERGCVVDWHINVPMDDAARPFAFAGASSGESVIVFATPDRGMAMNNQLYDELSRLNNEIINRERELARKNAALERISAEKSRVVAIAAHDLRNPLTIIASYTDLLKKDNVIQGDHALYIDEIQRSARFMIELVEELLDSSRVESGHLDLALRDIDLVKAARHAATVNRMRAERKEIEIACEEEAARAIIRADAVKLRQIINNLVVNAIKFSASHTRVTIRVRCSDGRAVLEVEDQGIGIPRDNLTAIFEPFRTLGPSGTAGERSTGLGLSIVKQLADLHGAAVQVESEVGRGSTFRVVFPTPPAAAPRP